MKVLPIKLPDELYHNLKILAKLEGTTMSELARLAFTELLRKKKTQPLTLGDSNGKKPRTTSEYLEQFIYKGKTYHHDKTDDELLYGGKLGEY